MKEAILMRKDLFLIILIVIQSLTLTQLSQGQVKDSISADTTNVLTGIYNYLDINSSKWLTIGTQFDFFNSTFGLLISNGYDERPLFHFEDISEDVIFEILGSTDFVGSYSFGGDIALQYPIRSLSLISIGYSQFNYSQIQFFKRDIHISAMKYLKKIDAGLILNIGYKTLNDFNNVGVDLGLQKVLIYRKLFSEFSMGYYFDYFIYSAAIQGFVYRNNIGVRIDYERLDKYNFLTLGLNFTLNRRSNR
jgi:hypothetical protein